MRPEPRLWKRYVIGGVLVTGVYFLIRSTRVQDLMYELVGMSAVVAVVVGTRRNKPAKRLPWVLIAAGLLLFVVGDVVLNTLSDFLHSSPPFPSVADAFYLTGYPVLGAGLMLFVRHRTPGRDRTALIDSLIIACGIGLLSWVYLMSPLARDETLSMPATVVSMAYPLMDLFLVGVAARLAVGAGIRSPAFRFLLASLGLLLITDALYTLPVLNGSYHTGSPIDAGWLLSYVLWGTAALHPAMRTLSDRVPPERVHLTRGRLCALTLAVVLAPTILVIQALRSQDLDLIVIASGCVLLFVLVLLRMAGLVREVERSSREIRTQSELLAREQEAVAELRELNRLKTEFVAVASHELRTPVTSLIGYTETLLQPRFENDGAARKEFLQAIKRQGVRLRDLVENLFAESTFESDGFEVSLEAVDVASLLADVREAFGVRADRMKVVVPPGAPTLDTDRELLGRAVANLVDNALKYSAEDSPCELTASWEDGLMRLSVRDRGLGIAEENLTRIFDRFYQVDSSSTRSVGGVGLGLSLAREIAEALGGTVEVESSLGVGSTFTVSLPIDQTMQRLRDGRSPISSAYPV